MNNEEKVLPEYKYDWNIYIRPFQDHLNGNLIMLALTCGILAQCVLPQPIMPRSEKTIEELKQNSYQDRQDTEQPSIKISLDSVA